MPPVLIVVDNKNKKAYWKYMDFDTLSESHSRIKGDSVVIYIPVENCIDGSMDYIDKWTAIVRERSHIVWDYENIRRKNAVIEQQMAALQKIMQPITLPDYAIKEIHLFLDSYNFILDKELKVVKDTLYFDYWKIGIGIVKYTVNEIAFVLMPDNNYSNEPLIKELRNDGSFDLMQAFEQQDALMYVTNEEKNIMHHLRKGSI